MPVTARSKAWVCARSLAGTAGSNPAGARIFACCECCVLLGRGLCDGLITRSEEPYRLFCVVICDQETSKRSHGSALGLRSTVHRAVSVLKT